MRVLKSKIALVTLAVAGAFASSAAVAAPLVLAPTCPAALANFSVELPPAAAAAFVVAPADTVQSPLGFGIALTQTRFIRYDLAPTAKFGVALTSAALTIPGLAAGDITLVQGGATTDAYAVFQVNASVAVTSAVVVSFAPGTITLPAASTTTQTVAYSLHETAVSAANAVPSNVARLSNNGPCAIAAFIPSYTFAIANVNEVVDAVTGFKKFTTAPDTALDIGGAITLKLVAVPPLVAATGVAVTMPNLFAAGTTISVTSSDAAGFGALPAVGNFWESAAVCTATVGAPLATARTANTVTFPTVMLAAAADVDTKFLCGLVNGTTIIPAQNLTARLIPAAGSGVGTTPIAIANNVTTITQNGAQLQSPWFSINPAVASFFFFTNTSTLDMAYTATVYCEVGNTCTNGTGATGSIPAGKSVRVDATGAAGVLTSASVATRASVLFNIVGATGSVQGDLVTVNPNGANQTTSSHLIRPGTN